MRRLRNTVWTLCLLSLLGTGGLSAADRFVSPAGSNGNPGTEAQPWATLTYAAAQLVAGDTLYARSGTYAERLLLIGKNGTIAMPITIRNYPGETPVIDGAAITVPSGGRQGLVAFTHCSYLVFQGFEVTNFVTTAGGRIPMGIQVEGAGTGLQIIGNKVHHIWQSSTNGGANGFGIGVYGTEATPIQDFVLDGNEVYDLRTGQSESVAINGNVVGFSVTNNVVHDCNNIGIDFIGYEGSGPSGFDRARDGVCSGNTVYNIDSAFNPGYGGDFTTGGGSQSAAGIYVDGGTNIVVERNHCYHCNFGVELASENAAGATDYILLRNNLLHHNLNAGLIMGGYDPNRGITDHCEITNNVIYQNDTAVGYSGQVTIQFYFQNNVFKNNIVWANATGQMIIHYVTGGTALQRSFPAGNVFDYNVYYFDGVAGDAEFGLNPAGSNQSYYGLDEWQTAVGGEANSAFNNPGFATAIPGINPLTTDFKLAETSFCRDRGEPAPAFAPGVGEKDFFGASRVANGRVDVGLHEWMTAWQAWLDQYFALPDGGGVADALADPDDDSASNLMEFSQGMDPTQSDATSLPTASFAGGSSLRFTYRKDQPSLTYEVETSTTLPGPLDWPNAIPSEQTDGFGSYWRDFSLTGGPLFIRLKVTQ
ncbi:MAG: DUF5123 domain-containing protein [Verrucomicrobiaceae bacterium]|nr:DUF5123 domain-containing protein [Verrucomicrobiaceae bacterium]